MKGRNHIQWCSILLLALCLVGCKVRRPSTVLTDAQMEEVLYDYHIARAMGEELSVNESYKKVLYVESAFKKHGITEAQFDSSMVWFARYPDALAKIYEKVNERLKAERDGINHLIALRDHKPKESLPGDSIDVWPWQRIYQLTGTPLDNKLTFTIPSDTNFKDRDTLRWTVRFRFREEIDTLYAPVMAMQIVYDSDTVIGSLRKVLGTGTETLCLHADTLGAIEEIRGFIYYSPKDSLSGAHGFLADRISLMRYHATDTLDFSKSDSLQVDSLKADTLKKAETKPKVATPSSERKSGPSRPRPNVKNVPTLDAPEPLELEKPSKTLDRNKSKKTSVGNQKTTKNKTTNKTVNKTTNKSATNTNKTTNKNKVRKAPDLQKMQKAEPLKLQEEK